MATQGTAVVTGAGQGLGRAIALQLAEDGFDVVVNDLSVSLEKLEVLVGEIQKKGRASSKYVADVSSEAEVKEMVEFVVKHHGGIDVMVANAGILNRTGLTVTDVNSRGVLLCYKYAGIQMIKQGRGGRLIGASSYAGTQGVATQSIYSASKFAVRGLTQSAAQEFGAHKITVNAYAPGVIRSAMTVGAAEESAETASALKQLEERTPIKPGVGEPEDVAHLVSFLASKRAPFITGQTISINGGIHFI